MASEDFESQENELLALSSIYGEDVFLRAETALGGELRIFLDLPAGFTVRGAHIKTGSGGTGPGECVVVQHLPPLVMNFELPSDYPSTSPPQFTISCKWLSREQLSWLCHTMDELWQENRGMEILYTWSQFLKEDTLDFLRIAPPLEVKSIASGTTRKRDHGKTVRAEAEPEDLVKTAAVDGGRAGLSQPPAAHGEAKQHKRVPGDVRPLDPRAIQTCESWSSLYGELLDYDQAQRQKVFSARVFNCHICLCEKLGSSCVNLSGCEHVYCRDCLSAYFQLQIQEGNVHSLTCPEPKCQTAATPSQVRELVGEELFSRYDRLLLQSSLDLMADVVYCPRMSCQTPVLLEPNKTMGHCPQCKFAFCNVCRHAYHGISACIIKSENLGNIVKEYNNADAASRVFLEQRYGKHTIKRAIEEVHSKDWLAQNAKACPRCCTHIQKVDGCNKMTCTSCQLYFCWICLKELSRANPYGHFNEARSPCFNRLFQGGEGDDDFFLEGSDSDEDDGDDINDEEHFAQLIRAL
ncbi:E3 ubiquitin-protein ligase RNF14 isoform X1 [Lampetra fluviatilis]